MINYYYEITDDVTVFGYKYKYLALYDLKPDNMMWPLHDSAIKHSNRVWLENANGVSLVKGNKPVSAEEFIWIKLKCRDIQTL